MSKLKKESDESYLLELKEKIASVNLGGVAQANLASDSDAVEALVSLGYYQYQARDAMKLIDPALDKSEAKITAALKILAKK